MYHGGKWLAGNGSYYSVGWWGSPAVGLRSTSVSVYGAFRSIGRFAFYGGAFASAVEAGFALSEHNYSGAAGCVFDVGMGALGVWGGPPGMIVSAGYFGVFTAGGGVGAGVTTGSGLVGAEGAPSFDSGGGGAGPW
jgi:hypothetical protein